MAGITVTEILEEVDEENREDPKQVLAVLLNYFFDGARHGEVFDIMAEVERDITLYGLTLTKSVYKSDK